MTKEELKAFYEEGFRSMKGGRLVITAEEEGIAVDSSMTIMGALLGASTIIGSIMEEVSPGQMPLVTHMVYAGIVTGHSNDEVGEANTMLLADILHGYVHAKAEGRQ